MSLSNPPYIKAPVLLRATQVSVISHHFPRIRREYERQPSIGTFETYSSASQQFAGTGALTENLCSFHQPSCRNAELWVLSNKKPSKISIFSSSLIAQRIYSIIRMSQQRLKLSMKRSRCSTLDLCLTNAETECSKSGTT